MSAHNQNPNHFIRLYRATGYSIQGLKSTFQHEQAFRLEAYILLILLPLALWLAKTPLEFLLLIGSWLLVMVVELLNSAVEAAIDRIGMEKHELSGRAKDSGSAAVMISVLIALGVWMAVLLS